MSFKDRVQTYVLANYEIPKTLHFYQFDDEIEFEDFVDAYIEGLSEYAGVEYTEQSDDSDVYEVGEGILNAMINLVPMCGGSIWVNGVEIVLEGEA